MHLTREKVNIATLNLSKRFRGLLPVVIDVETSGLNPATDALLEIGMVNLAVNSEGKLVRGQTLSYHVEPFIGAHIHPDALKINGIDIHQPLRLAIPEEQAIKRLFAAISIQLEQAGCYRGVLVGHNAWFDLSFILAAAKRCGIRQIPLHHFTTFDTASLSAVACGETVLARATRRARIPFDVKHAHSAVYDAEKTAELFCYITNKWG